MRRAHLLYAASLSLATTALACGPAPQASVAPGATDQPKRGGVLNFHIPVDPNDWDPTISGKSLSNGQNGHNLASEGLLTYKSGPGVPHNSNELIPQIAERWEMTPDAKTFTFYLKKGLKWPDLPPANGRAFTSADVKFSYEYYSRTGPYKDAKLPPSTYAAYFEGVESIEAPDPNSAVVKFKDPFPPFPYYAASGWNPIFLKEIYDQDGNFSNRILGMGPWQLDTANVQAGARFPWKRNANYRDANLPYVDEVRYLILKDDATQRAAFQTKQVDALIEQMSVREFNEIKQKTGAVGYENFGAVADWRFYVNMRKAPLTDKRVRQALSMSIDRDKFLGTIGDGSFKRRLEGVQTGLFTDEEIQRFLPYDPNKAKQLLSEAGFPNGLEIEMTFPGNAYGDIYITGLQLLQAQLKPVGININLKSEDKNDWNSKRRTGDYVLGLQQSNSVEADMDSFVFNAWYSKSRSNYNGINDPKVDELSMAQRREGNAEKRRLILRELVTYVMDNAYSIPIGNVGKYEVWQPYVKGYATAEYHKGTRVTDVWLDK